MRGKRLALSAPRRIVADILHFAAKVPSVPVERMMDLRAVIEARATWPVRPAWTSIFAKAYGLTAQEFPELRRVYLKWPWPHLYEYPTSAGAIAIDRIHQGEPCVLMRLIKNPAAYRIGELSHIIRHAKQAPLDDVRDFNRALTIARLPAPIRRLLWWAGLNIGRQRANYFGTFGVTAVSLHGGDLIHPVAPTTTLLTFGVIDPAGRVPVRIIFDHRVFDGVPAAHMLARLEAIPCGPIVEELRAEAPGEMAHRSPQVV
jgi:pyruvate/2-oxoglutarate dehydrogenase complex dihydrolipoamide acyltransferase (E2) component